MQNISTGVESFIGRISMNRAALRQNTEFKFKNYKQYSLKEVIHQLQVINIKIKYECNADNDTFFYFCVR